MLIDNLIENCSKCGALPKLSCNSFKTGTTNLLILGESPAKDGWIFSGKAFYNNVLHSNKNPLCR